MCTQRQVSITGANHSNPFLAMALVLFCLASAEGAIDLTLVSQSEIYVTTSATNDRSSLVISELPVLGETLVIDATGVGDPISRATVNWFTRGAGTIIRIDYDEQSLSPMTPSPNSVGRSAQSNGDIFFTVDEPTPYEVTGSYTGSADRPAGRFGSDAALHKSPFSAGDLIYQEYDSAGSVESASFSFNDATEGNLGDVVLIGERIGILQPGDYYFVHRSFAQVADSFPSAGGVGSGFVQLVLGDPTVPLTVFGDFNDDGMLGTTDIDLLSEAVRTSSGDLDFDLSGNGVVDSEDRRVWVEDVYGTLFGDASLDRQVSFIDFTSLSFFFDKAGGWEQGDFDGNGFVQFPDFLLLSRNFGKSAENVATATVPEPASCMMLLSAVTLLGRMRRKR